MAFRKPRVRQPDAYEKLEEIAELEEGVSEWEIARLEEWLPLLESGQTLSPKQLASVEKIHRERVILGIKFGER